MSPEQVRGQEVDLRTDIYSLGATLYESLVGDTPFDGSTHFEIMTKHLSEAPKPPSSHGIEVPKSVEDAVMQSLAKKAEGRFENARDFRKILESALKEGDAGLVETQRIAREILGDIRTSAKPSKEERSALGNAQTARAATASDLADELEPGTASPRKLPRPPRAKWPFIVLALLVIGGGGATATLLFMKKGKPSGYQAKTKLPGVTLTVGKKFDNVLVETTGTVQPDDVYTIYAASLAELETFETQNTAKRDVVQEIILVPGGQLCGLPITRANPDATCDTYTTAISGKRQLFVADDPSTLQKNIRAGAAQAVCDFAFVFADAAADERASAKAVDAACQMAKRFIGGK
jgi:hypothetical protein